MSISAETSTELKGLRGEILRGTRVISLSGLTSIASKSFVLWKLRAETAKTFVIVTDSNREAEIFENDLDFWTEKWKLENGKSRSNSKISILTLPSFESDIYANVSPHAETQESRALTLWKLTFNQPDFLILSAKSLITKTLAPVEIRKLGAKLKRDEDFPPEKLIERLASVGYMREEPIKSIGEFSVRGGIIDVWSPTAENPVRIEFFGDTVDSIREFDPETQLSIGQLQEISIAPMREFAAGSQDFKDWSFFARERFTGEKFSRALKDRTQFADEGESFSGWEFLFPIVQPRTASIFDFLKDAVFVIDEPTIIEQTLGDFYENLKIRFTEIIESGEIGIEPTEFFLEPETLSEKFQENQRLELRALGKTASQIDEEFSL